MGKCFCAKCGALLGKNEFNYLDDIDGEVCDFCAHDDASTIVDNGRITQCYDIATV